MKRDSIKKLSLVTIFAIAMGFFEAAIVIYSRNLYYPEGFAFPLKGFINTQILGIEWIRELATIIMLIALAILVGKKFYGRLAYFIYAFAVWDIFYYISLKLTIDWPTSFLTWDLLFLIPWPWVGPVLAPILCAILMIVVSITAIHFRDLGFKIKAKATDFVIIIVGVLVVLYTWLYDYGKIIIEGGFAKDFFTLSTNEQFQQVIINYSPVYYNWPVFTIGFIISSIGLFLIYQRTKNNTK